MKTKELLDEATLILFQYLHQEGDITIEFVRGNINFIIEIAKLLEYQKQREEQGN